MKKILPKKESLCQLVNILHGTTGLDIDLYDNQANLIVTFMLNPYPPEILPFYTNWPSLFISELSGCTCTTAYSHSFSDLNLLHYSIKLVLPDSSVFYVSFGPYLTKPYSDAMVLSVMNHNGFSLSRKDAFIQFYREIRLMPNNYTYILWLVGTVLSTLPNTESIPVLFHNDEIDPLPACNDRIFEDVSQLNSYIMTNYQAENLYRAAISAGNEKAAFDGLSTLSPLDFSDRTPGNPLRTLKNLCFVGNAIYRIAASDGGADAIKIHYLNDYFARKIETIQNSADAMQIDQEMIHEYCKLVRESKTKGKSKIVRNIIEYLYANFDQKISLKKIAAEMHFSESYLSHIFKEQTGFSINDYINKIRIEEAKRLLKTSRLSITSIAMLVGFNNYTWFSVEFKRIVGCTAHDYRKQLY